MISASSDDLPVGGMDAARMENGGTESPGVMEEKKSILKIVGQTLSR
jgi:hypothetical protein